jgi:hypothetical protein
MLSSAACILPWRPGNYRLGFEYVGQPYAEFKIVEPVLQMWRHAKLARPKTIRRRGTPSRQEERDVIAGVVRYEGNCFVIVSRTSRSPATLHDRSRPLREGATFDEHTAMAFGLYHRILETSAGVRSLELLSDDYENLTIHCELDSEEKRTIKLDAKRNVIER